MNVEYYKSPVGWLEITENDGFITALRVVKNNTSSSEKAANGLLNEAVKQLKEYFSGERTVFDLPLKQEGTAFQQSAWEFLKTIPYGKTVSYKEEAEAINSAKAFRAVGSANGVNKIAIIVPCHRVVNSSGKLGGYAYGLDVKSALLELEGKLIGEK